MEIAYNQVCSKCQRTKSQVEEQERKPFRTHVSEVQGVVESSPYTRVNADATFEAFYQEKLLDLEQRRTDHLEVCSDLKNRSYFEKTDSYESDNEEVRARTESLQDAVSDKRPFDATAADEIDFDGNRDKNELTCQELDERVNELDQRCHTLKARMLDTHPLLEEAQGLLRQLRATLSKECNERVIAEVGPGLDTVRLKLGDLEAALKQNCAAIKEHQAKMMSMVDVAFERLSLFTTARLDFESRKREITDNPLWSYATSEISVQIGLYASWVKGMCDSFWKALTLSYFKKTPGAAMGKYFEMGSTVISNGILYYLDTDEKSKLQFAVEQVEYLRGQLGRNPDMKLKPVVVPASGVQKLEDFAVQKIMKDSETILKYVEILEKAATRTGDINPAQLQETQRLTEEALKSYDNAMRRLEEKAKQEQMKMQMYAKLAGDAAYYYSEYCK